MNGIGVREWGEWGELANMSLVRYTAPELFPEQTLGSGPEAQGSEPTGQGRGELLAHLPISIHTFTDLLEEVSLPTPVATPTSAGCDNGAGPTSLSL